MGSPAIKQVHLLVSQRKVTKHQRGYFFPKVPLLFHMILHDKESRDKKGDSMGIPSGLLMGNKNSIQLVKNRLFPGHAIQVVLKISYFMGIPWNNLS